MYVAALKFLRSSEDLTGSQKNSRAGTGYEAPMTNSGPPGGFTVVRPESRIRSGSGTKSSPLACDVYLRTKPGMLMIGGTAGAGGSDGCTGALAAATVIEPSICPQSIVAGLSVGSTPPHPPNSDPQAGYAR